MLQLQNRSSILLYQCFVSAFTPNHVVVFSMLFPWHVDEVDLCEQEALNKKVNKSFLLTSLKCNDLTHICKIINDLQRLRFIFLKMQFGTEK